MQTYTTKASEIQRRWYLVDADDEVLGRLASEVAALLMGKWKTRTCPYLDVGDHVVVINADKVRLTGRKLQKKTFFRHTGWIGGVRVTSLRDRMQKEPDEVLRDAVKGCCPTAAWPADDPQAQGLRGAGASARGPAADSAEAGTPWQGLSGPGGESGAVSARRAAEAARPDEW